MGRSGFRNSRGSVAARLSEAEVEQFVARHGDTLRNAARRAGASREDAEDALQTALETLIHKAPSSDPAELLPWMVVVTRNAALMARRKDVHLADLDVTALLDSQMGGVASPEQCSISRLSVAHARDAIQRLRPAQARCLVLLASGMSYEEIAQALGLSRTKVHRYVTDARKHVLHTVRQIELGRECERLLPSLALFADGEADAATRRDVLSHTRHCQACRAVVRDYRELPCIAILVLPADLLATDSPAAGILRQTFEALQSVFTSTADRAGSYAANLQPAVESGFAKKAVVVSTVAAAALAGGYESARLATGGSEAASHAAQPKSAVVAPAPRARDSRQDPSSARKRRRARTHRSQPASEGDLLGQRSNTSPRTASGDTVRQVDRNRYFDEPDQPSTPDPAPSDSIETAAPSDDPKGAP